jgi:D-serine dehydratase
MKTDFSAGKKWVGGPLETIDKGAPGYGGEVPLDQTGERGWNLLREDMPLPVAVLKEDALRRNSGWMRDYLALSGAKIAPHGKTSMAPWLYDLQLQDGAWAITLATPHQIRVARRCGFDRVFLANQLVGRSAIEYVFRELEACPDFEFYCLCDSVPHVEQLAAVGERLRAGRSLNVLVEVGFEGGRTGCRTNHEAMQVAQAIFASSHLTLCGVEGYEGVVQGRSDEEQLQRVGGFLDRVVQVTKACAEQDLFETDEVIITAGGSSYFDVVVQKFEGAKLNKPVSMVIRSGCYLTFDSVMVKNSFSQLKKRAPTLTERLGELQPALEVWAYVQSRPEQELVIATIGKRDISYDDMPVPLHWFRPGTEPMRPSPVPGGHEVFLLNDQHCYLKVTADSPLAVGDMMGFGISHPCLTFDKWRVLHRVDEAYNIVGSLRTFF